MDKLVVFLGILVLIALCVWIGPFVVMICWNFVAPIFWAGAPHLTWLQTFAAMIVLSTITAGFRTVFNKE